MKQLLLLLLTPFLLSSCFSLEKKTTKMEVEVYMVSPSQDVSRFYLRGTKGSGVKRRMILVEDNNKYSLGDRFQLIPE